MVALIEANNLHIQAYRPRAEWSRATAGADAMERKHYMYHLSTILTQPYRPAYNETAKMIPNPPPIQIPSSYESVPTTHIKVSHHPAGAPTATPVVVVTLNRPEKHNAFTNQMMEDFEKVFPMFDVDDRVKVIVLTGAGRTFCAGADLERGFTSHVAERLVEHRDRLVDRWMASGGTGC